MCLKLFYLSPSTSEPSAVTQEDRKETVNLVLKGGQQQADMCLCGPHTWAHLYDWCPSSFICRDLGVEQTLIVHWGSSVRLLLWFLPLADLFLNSWQISVMHVWMLKAFVNVLLHVVSPGPSCSGLCLRSTTGAAVLRGRNTWSGALSERQPGCGFCTSVLHATAAAEQRRRNESRLTCLLLHSPLL